jgi:hypothetical protein
VHDDEQLQLFTRASAQRPAHWHRPAPETAEATDRSTQTPAAAELWNGQPGVTAGPGVVQQGMHVQYLPAHRPGPLTRHGHAGTIVSIGTARVRWRPYAWHQDVRTPLAHMRINPVKHVNQAEDVRQKITALNSGQPLPRWPQWCAWSVARHLEYASQQSTPAATAVPVVVVPCSSTKKPLPEGVEALPAAELYQGNYFTKCLTAARAIPGAEVLIFSGLYGLITPDTPIAPYEKRLDPRNVDHAKHRAQVSAMGRAVSEAQEVIALAGKDYADATAAVWPHAVRPLAGAGIGTQLQRLTRIAASDDPQATALDYAAQAAGR